MHICDLSPSEIAALTRILQLRPGEDGITHATRVISAISDLPSHLKRPNALSLLVLPSQKPYSHQCALHKLLHAPAVHELFNLLTLEVGLRLNSLMSNKDCLSTEQESRLSALRAVHALWLSPEIYAKTFQEPAATTKWHNRPEECEACTLARIGGDIETLLNLRMVLLSRSSSKKLRSSGPPRLIAWVETWIATLTAVNMSPSDFETMICKNDEEGQELKECRKQIWYESIDKRQQRRLSMVYTDPPSIPYTDQANTCRSEPTSSEPTQKDSISQSEHAAVRPAPTYFGPGTFTAAGPVKIGCSSSPATTFISQRRTSLNTAASISTCTVDTQMNNSRAISSSNSAHPLFAHHPAWIPGSAERNARRYQALLSSPTSPPLPRRSNQRPAPRDDLQTPVARPKLEESTVGGSTITEAPVSTAEIGSTGLTRGSISRDPDFEGGWI